MFHGLFLLFLFMGYHTHESGKKSNMNVKRRQLIYLA